MIECMKFKTDAYTLNMTLCRDWVQRAELSGRTESQALLLGLYEHGTNKDLQGTKSLLALIQTLGSWPVTSGSISGTWQQSSWSFGDALSTAFSLGAAPFFSLGIGEDYMNNSVNILQADQSGLLFPSETVYTGQSEETFHTAYVNYFIDIGTLLGGTNVVIYLIGNLMKNILC